MNDVRAGSEAPFVSQLETVQAVAAFVCARHRLSADEADDFASHVRLKVMEDDYAILRKFEGRSSLRTFLTVVVERLFLDYRIHAWGKWRPSARARRAGPTAVLLERLLGRDGCTFEEACETIVTNHRIAITRDELERLAAQLSSERPRQFEGDDTLALLPSGDRRQDAVAEDRDRAALAARLTLALRAAFGDLEPQDRLILALHFHDGHTIADVAATLGLNQKVLYRRIARTLEGVRRRLESSGVDRAAVRDLLENPTMAFDGVLEAAVENANMRRSIEKGSGE